MIWISLYVDYMRAGLHRVKGVELVQQLRLSPVIWVARQPGDKNYDFQLRNLPQA